MSLAYYDSPCQSKEDYQFERIFNFYLEDAVRELEKWMGCECPYIFLVKLQRALEDGCDWAKEIVFDAELNDKQRAALSNDTCDLACILRDEQADAYY